MRYAARIRFDKETETYIVWFPDVRVAHSFGTSIEDALMHGRNALLSVLEILAERGDPFPSAKAKGKYYVEVPATPRRLMAWFAEAPMPPRARPGFCAGS